MQHYLGIYYNVLTENPVYFPAKCILLSFLKKSSVTPSYRLSVRFSSMKKFFSIAIEADAESPACPVEFLASILIRFRAENVRSTEAVDTVMVNAKQTNPAVELVVVSDDLALDLFLQSEARAMSSMAS